MNKLRWFTICCTISFLFLDASERFFSQSKLDNTINAEPQIFEQLTWIPTNKYNAILEAYESYQVPEHRGQISNKEKPDILAVASMAKANIQNKQLELKAIWYLVERYALLKIHNLNDDTSELIKVKDGGEMFGFSVVIISQTQVKLLRGDRVIELVMYQPQKKEKV
jgi:hypothetical protein